MLPAHAEETTAVKCWFSSPELGVQGRGGRRSTFVPASDFPQLGGSSFFKPYPQIPLEYYDA